jgi:hypothetical protein
MLCSCRLYSLEGWDHGGAKDIYHLLEVGWDLGLRSLQKETHAFHMHLPVLSMPSPVLAATDLSCNVRCSMLSPSRPESVLPNPLPIDHVLTSFQNCHGSLFSSILSPGWVGSLKEALCCLSGGDWRHDPICCPHRDKAQTVLRSLSRSLPTTLRNWSLPRSPIICSHAIQATSPSG